MEKLTCDVGEILATHLFWAHRKVTWQSIRFKYSVGVSCPGLSVFLTEGKHIFSMSSFFFFKRQCNDSRVFWVPWAGHFDPHYLSSFSWQSWKVNSMIFTFIEGKLGVTAIEGSVQGHSSSKTHVLSVSKAPFFLLFLAWTSLLNMNGETSPEGFFFSSKEAWESHLCCKWIH